MKTCGMRNCLAQASEASNAGLRPPRNSETNRKSPGRSASLIAVHSACRLPTPALISYRPGVLWSWWVSKRTVWVGASLTLLARRSSGVQVSQVST